MENLTQKQNEIISNLVAEFTKINESNSVTPSSNPLLNIANDFDSAKNKEIVDRASIEARNNVAVAENRGRCEEDADDLQCLLNELDKGLFVKVEHSHRNSYIYIKSEKWTGPVIKYELPILGQEIYKYLPNIEKLGGTTIMYKGYAWHDYLEIIHDDEFRTEFIELLNR